MKKPMFTLLTTAILGLTASVQAQLTWDWTLTGTDTGSGTFTTTTYLSPTANPNYSGVAGYLVTGATGTFDGDTITGVVDPTTAFNTPPGSDGGWNQLLYPNDGVTSGVVDYYGILLTTSNPNEAYAGFYSPSSDSPPDLNPTDVDTGEFNSLATYGVDKGVLTIVATPEPSASLLALAGLGSLGLLGKLRRRK